MEHSSDILAFGEPLSYLRAAYIDKGCLDDVLLEFFDAPTAPNGFEFGEVRRLATGPVHSSQIAGVDQFDVRLRETHHTAKRDAPSGTAIALEATLATELGRSVPISSVRTGSVPGTHEVTFDGPFEQITLTHEALDRRVFADGALTAARWLVGRTGVFTMDDVFGVSIGPKHP